MSFRLPNAVKSASVYVFANLLSRGLAIITVPIFTRLMTTDQIGIVTIYTSWFSLISAFSTLSLTSGGFSLAMKEYKEKRDNYVSSILFLTTIIAGIILIAYIMMHNFFDRVFGLSRKLSLLMMVGFILSPARDFWLAKERYEYKYKSAAIVTIFSAVIASALSVIAVFWANGKGLEETAYYRLIVNYFVIYFIDAIIFVVLFIKGKSFVNREYWTFSLKLSLPLVGYSISTQILNVSDRMMIDIMVGKSAVGIYGTLYTVSSISIMIWTTINASFVPYLFENIDKRKEKIGKIANFLLILYSGIAIILTYFSPEIVKILATDEYMAAKYIMPPIAAGVFMISVSNLYSNILVYYKKTTYIMYVSIVAAALNVILNYFFIMRYGYVAAAYTTLFSYIVMAALEYYWANLYDKKYIGSSSRVYDDKMIFRISMATIVLCMIGLALYQLTIIRYISAGIIGLLMIYAIAKNKSFMKTIKT